MWFICKYKYQGKNITGVERDILNKKLDDLAIEKRISEERLQTLIKDIDSARSELSAERQAGVELNRQLSAKEADYKNLNIRLQEQKEDIEKIQDKFSLEFKNLANEILEEKTKKFTEQNRANLDEILKPLSERIKEFEKRVEETYDKESKERFSLQKEIKNLAELNHKISADATNLTNALKGQVKSQGNWGEVVLENILESSGLVRGREYFVQPSYPVDGGRRLQPDIVVHYPGNRNVVIDSKVSLTAYERYATSETKEEQEAAIKKHIQSIKNHINELGQKNYQDIYQIKSLDFVMMFLPVEPAYMVAIQNESTLWNFAYDKRVLLISPTNLIAALKMISSLWRQEYQNRNALEIAEKSGALYDKFVSFYEDLIDVERKLESTQRSFKEAKNKLREGKGNLIKRAQDIQKLGAKTKKSLPVDMLDSVEEEEDSS